MRAASTWTWSEVIHIRDEVRDNGLTAALEQLEQLRLDARATQLQGLHHVLGVALGGDGLGKSSPSSPALPFLPSCFWTALGSSCVDGWSGRCASSLFGFAPLEEHCGLHVNGADVACLAGGEYDDCNEHVHECLLRRAVTTIARVCDRRSPRAARLERVIR